MFKEKFNILVILGLVSFFSIFFIACAKGPVTTDNDVLLPDKFVNVYMIMDYSKHFSDNIGKITARLLEDELIDQEQVDKIGEVWKKHKYYSNLLQKEVSIWYDRIKKDRRTFNRQEIYRIIDRLIVQTDVMCNILSKHIGKENALLLNNINNRIISTYGYVVEENNGIK